MIEDYATKEDALESLHNVKEELEHWKQYRNELTSQYTGAKKLGVIGFNFMKELSEGIKEAEENIELLADVRLAQLNYCRKKEWLD